VHRAHRDPGKCGKVRINTGWRMNENVEKGVHGQMGRLGDTMLAAPHRDSARALGPDRASASTTTHSLERPDTGIRMEMANARESSVWKAAIIRPRVTLIPMKHITELESRV
jgi:hypothetical protein